MAQFMLLHVGFEQPTPEIMTKWQEWFESVSDKAVGHGGFMHGRRLTDDGVESLEMGLDSMTGYSIIEAENIDEAVTIAQGNPFITAIQIYEIRQHGG
ncbi:MAG: hypothetical protein AAFX10_16635 [Pseudomonadota bacterium]